MQHAPRLLVRLMLAGLAAAPALAAAAPAPVPAGSPYRTDAQNSHVEDATSRGVNQVNMITCIMSAMRPEALVNQGNYIALIDEVKCDSEGRSSSANSGSTSSGSNAPSYTTAVVNSARATNEQPMRVRTWLNEQDGDFSATIFVNISASEAPSQGNPYGVFRLDYCGKPDSGPCQMQGYLEGSAAGISYFELEQGDHGPQSKALHLQTDGDSGQGVLQMNEDGSPVAYSFAYNASFFRRGTGTTDECFSRDASDPQTAMSVWRYGLYNASSGERVTRMSGFPIEYTNNGRTYNGYMGYWGLSLPPDAAIASGASVQRVEYSAGQAPQKTDYTLVKAGGRLVKYSKQTRTLAQIDKIKFTTGIWDTTGFFTGAQANRQYEMYWDNTAGDFKVTGTIECGQSGCSSSDLANTETVQASYFATRGGLRGWSQALGGELFVALGGVSGPVQSDGVQVIYRVQDLVYPTEMAALPELFCLRDCPTAATMADFFSQGTSAASPFTPGSFNRWNPASASDVVRYSIDTAGVQLRDSADSPLVFTDRDAMQSQPQYMHGVRTGRLFTTLSDALCTGSGSTYCEQQIEQLGTYYQWETGANQWNQFAAVKDGAGQVVTFDAPMQVDYSVPADAVRYGQYAGKDIVLQYGGFGDLWGIPGHCVSRVTNAPVSCETPDSRYVPAFVIPFDETVGRVTANGTPLLVKWLDREIRFARKPLTACTNAGLALPTGLVLPDATGLNNPADSASSIYIGAQPSVGEAPRVIHGDVKY
jgi:hypothetical protein